MFITIPSIPLLLAVLLTLFLYLKVSIEPVLEDAEEAMIASYLNTDAWLIKEYGIVGFVLISVLQASPRVRGAIQKI